jgi:protein-S-isoprenylcysteine O-methyltransferase Ste14
VHPLGLVAPVCGVVGLLWSVRDFYVSGKGTLAPWAPPASLVVVRLYRYTRNPMYVSVTLILIGWAVSFALLELFLYAIVVVIVFHLRVVLGEEPWIARTRGSQWHEYDQRVPRWLF